jgi:hypothetical protein
MQRLNRRHIAPPPTPHQTLRHSVKISAIAKFPPPCASREPCAQNAQAPPRHSNGDKTSTSMLIIRPGFPKKSRNAADRFIFSSSRPQK